MTGSWVMLLRAFDTGTIVAGTIVTSVIGTMVIVWGGYGAGAITAGSELNP